MKTSRPLDSHRDRMLRQIRNKRKIAVKKEDTSTKLLKLVGMSSPGLGRIYLPGSWIGRKVIVTLVKRK